MAGMKHIPKEPRPPGSFFRDRMRRARESINKEKMAYSYYTVEEKAMSSFFNKKTAPQHIAKKTDTTYKTMPLKELKAKGIWNSRLDKIIPYIPKGAWIAGGFLRALVANEDDSGGDIDFFFHTEEAFNQMLDLIKYPTAKPGAEKAFGYYALPEYEAIEKLRIVDCESLISTRPNIQLVRLYWFDSPEHVIDSFDFTVCQFITDGETLWFNPQSFDDIATKTIREHRPTNDAIATLNRILKYQRKGYKISTEEFSNVEKGAVALLENPAEITQYFYRDRVETATHKHPESHLKYVWDYLETAPASRAAYIKAMKKEKQPYGTGGTVTITGGTSTGTYIKLDNIARTNYSWDGS